MMLGVVYSVFSSVEEARRVSELLLQRKLAVCVNIMRNIESMYLWSGVVAKSEEVAVIIKTRIELVHDVMSEVKRVHSYAVPCVLQVIVGNVDADYESWVESVLPKQ